MSKNLEHRMSPMIIGLKLDPSYPTRNDTANSGHEGTYRTIHGVRTIESGDIVRFGNIFGVVEVDHLDKLAGNDEMPVIDFGLNVWNVKGIIKAGGGTAVMDPGAELWYHEQLGSTNDTGTSKSDATRIKLYAGRPVAANHANLTVGTGTLYPIGTILDAVGAGITQDSVIPGEVRVLLGGSGAGIAGVAVT